LNKKLSYFTEVDSISQLFNNNDENMCLKQQFIPALNKLDKCLEFLNNNVMTKIKIFSFKLYIYNFLLYK